MIFTLTPRLVLDSSVNFFYYRGYLNNDHIYTLALQCVGVIDDFPHASDKIEALTIIAPVSYSNEIVKFNSVKSSLQYLPIMPIESA